MDSCISTELDEDLVLQIASIYKCHGGVLRIQKLSVQQQIKGTVDCGLFAIAFAVEACRNGRRKEMNLTCFDQTKMRKHLHDCLEKMFLDPFPRTVDTKVRVSKQSLETYVIAKCQILQMICWSVMDVTGGYTFNVQDFVISLVFLSSTCVKDAHNRLFRTQFISQSIIIVSFFCYVFLCI